MNRPLFLLSPSRNQLQSVAQFSFSTTMASSRSHVRTITTTAAAVLANRRTAAAASRLLHHCHYESPTNYYFSKSTAHQSSNTTSSSSEVVTHRRSFSSSIICPTTFSNNRAAAIMNITTTVKNSNHHPPPPSMVSSSSLSSSSRSSRSIQDDIRVVPSSRYCYSTISSSSKSSSFKNGSSLLPSKRQQQQHHQSSPLSTLSGTTNTHLKSSPSTTTRTKTTDANNNNNNSSMDDEYGNMESSGQIYTHPQPYHLESFGLFGHHIPGGRGHHHNHHNHYNHHPTTSPLPRGVLHPAYINYNTYGTLNSKRDNVLVICHALTGNSSLEAWWGELLGPGKAFDTDRYFVVCANILGSCYGSCGPSSARPGMDGSDSGDGSGGDDGGNVPRNKEGQAIYGIDFPDVSVRDTVRLQLIMLKNELKINSIKCVIGGSFGGMQTMEYCVMAGASRPDMGQSSMGSNGGGTMMMMMANNNDTNKAPPAAVPYGLGEFTTRRNGRIEPFVRSAVPIACGARHTAWQIAISETQRQAVYADPKWNNGRIDPHDPPHAGLSVARQVGMVSYRTPLGYHQKFGRALTDESGPSYGSRAPWQVKSYLEYQGKKFLDRFDPVTYVKLTEQMDSHDVSRGRGTMEEVLSHVEIPVCVLGIDSDILYPLREQEEIAGWLPNGELKIIHSDAGHDGFLLEQDQVAAHIKSFLYSHD